MRRRFTSAMTLWKARSWRRSSGWATAAAIVPRTRAGEGDRAEDSGWGGAAVVHQPRFISIGVDAIRRCGHVNTLSEVPAWSPS